MHALLATFLAQVSERPLLAQVMNQTYPASQPGYSFWSWWWFWLLVAAIVVVLMFAFGSYGRGPRQRGPPPAQP